MYKIAQQLDSITMIYPYIDIIILKDVGVAVMKLYIRIAIILASALLIGVLLVYDKQKEQLLPRSVFPLSEETIAAALEISGLDWHIERIDQRIVEESTLGVTYSLSVPNDKADYTTVFIDHYQSVRFGRRMQLIHYWNASRLADLQTQGEISWADFQETLDFAARLYGGFQSADEIYQACRSSVLPENEGTLWKGPLTGGYCVIESRPAIQSWKTAKGGRIYVTVYESESMFQQMQQEISRIKGEQQEKTIID